MRGGRRGRLSRRRLAEEGTLDDGDFQAEGAKDIKDLVGGWLVGWSENKSVPSIASLAFGMAGIKWQA